MHGGVFEEASAVCVHTEVFASVVDARVGVEVAEGFLADAEGEGEDWVGGVRLCW